jgi:cytidylate kinase
MENKIETEEVQAGFNKFEASINIRLAADRTQHTQQLKDFKDQLCLNADNLSAEVQEIRRLINKKQDRGDASSSE